MSHSNKILNTHTSKLVFPKEKVRGSPNAMRISLITVEDMLAFNISRSQSYTTKRNYIIISDTFEVKMSTRYVN